MVEETLVLSYGIKKNKEKKGHSQIRFDQIRSAKKYEKQKLQSLNKKMK